MYPFSKVDRNMLCLSAASKGLFLLKQADNASIENLCMAKG